MTNMTNKIKTYKKDFEFSYTGSAYSTVELLKTKPEFVEAVYIRPSFTDNCGLTDLCFTKNIPVICSDKAFGLVNQKENSYVIGVFRKYEDDLSLVEPHIALVNPSDMGNLGTIIRTAAGFNIKNVAIILPAADLFNPKTIRASMGALFRVNCEFFAGFAEYISKYREHKLFPFMLDGKISPDDCNPCLFSLVFGNEATGLDQSFMNIGQTVKIPLSDRVDSFNLGVAAGIGMYIFAVKNRLL